MRLWHAVYFVAIYTFYSLTIKWRSGKDVHFSSFVVTEWERFASQLAVVWKELAATWINYTRGHEAMVLHFEMLRLNPHHDLSRLLDYLGISVDEQRIGCVLNHIDGPFRRPQSSQQILFRTRYVIIFQTLATRLGTWFSRRWMLNICVVSPALKIGRPSLKFSACLSFWERW